MIIDCLGYSDRWATGGWITDPSVSVGFVLLAFRAASRETTLIATERDASSLRLATLNVQLLVPARECAEVPSVQMPPKAHAEQPH